MVEERTAQRTDGTLARRRVLGVAAWSAPVIALAVGAPLASASNILWEPHSGAHVQLGLWRGDLDDGTYYDGVYFGFDPAASMPVAVFSTNTPGLTATIHNYTATYILPFSVNWEITDSTYPFTVAPTPGRPGYYTYTFTRQASDVPRTVTMNTPLGDATPDVINASNSLEVPVWYGLGTPGTFVLGGGRPFAVEVTKRYDYTVHLPSGDVTGTFYRESVVVGTV